MDPQLFAVLSAVGGSGGLIYGSHQLRIYLQYRQRMAFARYVFDHTRSTDGLAGLTELAKAEQPVIGPRPTPGSASGVNGDGGE